MGIMVVPFSGGSLDGRRRPFTVSGFGPVSEVMERTPDGVEVYRFRYSGPAQGGREFGNAHYELLEVRPA